MCSHVAHDRIALWCRLRAVTGSISTALVISAALLATPAGAVLHNPNKPCTGKRGGISHCEGARFICRDGTTSQSKKDCRSFGGVHDQRPADDSKPNGKRK